MTSKEILSVLLSGVLKEKIDNLEQRFHKEESDITALEGHMDTIRKHVRDCGIITAEIIANIKAKEEAKQKAAANNSRANTEPNKPKGSATQREKSLPRDKSLGRINEQTKSPGLSRVKTEAALKSTKIDDDKEKHHGLVKTKSTVSVGSEKQSKTTPTQHARTSKSISKSSTQTPIKKKESISKIPNGSNEEKKAQRKKPAEKATSKKEKGMLKSNNKGELLKKNEKQQPQSKEEEKKPKESEIPPQADTTLQTNPPIIIETVIPKTIASTPTEALQPAQACISVEYAVILDDRWGNFLHYFNRYDKIKAMMLNKSFGSRSIASVISEIEKDIIDSEAKIKVFQEKYSPNELNKDIPAFTLSKGASKAIELLNEEMYYKLFTENTLPPDDILLIYRILFQLMNNSKEILETKNSQEFWTKSCKYFVTASSGKMGTFIQSCFTTLDFSDENIYKLNKLAAKHINKLSPNYFSKTCPTTGLIIFLLKDALEYTGILQEKKTLPARIYKNLVFSFETLKTKMERVASIQQKYFS